MSDTADDRELGISIRLVKQWDIDADRNPVRDDLVPLDALPLMMADTRPVSFAIKLASALAYLEEQRRKP